MDDTAPPLPVPDHGAATAARARQEQLTKPPGSLGVLEALAIRLAGLQGRTCPQVEAPAITVFAGDHGVVAEGVSAFPQAVTVEMVRNFARGGAAINVLARHIGAALEVVDVGTASDYETLAGVRLERAGAGTASFLAGPAMTADAHATAWASGERAADRAVAAGHDLYIVGEMGIGNTTAAAAVACALLDERPEAIVGPGTGLDPEGVRHKAAIIGRGLAWHAGRLTDPAEILARVGGYELVAMAGAYTRAAYRGLPVLVDGFIATTAALAAVRRSPGVAPWLIPAHSSAEPGHRRVLAALDDAPVFDLGMRLGEASGAAVAVPLIRLACSLHAEMATFDEAGVSAAGEPD